MLENVMIEYYFCQVIGTGRKPGTASVTDEGDSYRPAIDDYTNDWSALDGRDDYQTNAGWMFVKADITPDNHLRATQDARVEPIDFTRSRHQINDQVRAKIPDFNLDNKIDSQIQEDLFSAIKDKILANQRARRARQ